MNYEQKTMNCVNKNEPKQTQFKANFEDRMNQKSALPVAVLVHSLFSMMCFAILGSLCRISVK